MSPDMEGSRVAEDWFCLSEPSGLISTVSSDSNLIPGIKLLSSKHGREMGMWEASSFFDEV